MQAYYPCPFCNTLQLSPLQQKECDKEDCRCVYFEAFRSIGSIVCPTPECSSRRIEVAFESGICSRCGFQVRTQMEETYKK